MKASFLRRMSQHAYQQLPNDELPKEQQQQQRGQRKLSFASCRTAIYAVALTQALNALLVVAWLIWPSRGRALHQDELSATFAELHQYNTQIAFDETEFDSRNQNTSFWAQHFPEGQGIVNIPTTSSLAHAKQPSKASPLDSNYSLYQVSLFHHLHCLSMIKDMILDNGSSHHHSREEDTGHGLHCIDWLRQALICNADLTLDATDDYISFGQDSVHQCRDFEAILAWTQKHSYQGSLKDLENA